MASQYRFLFSPIQLLVVFIVIAVLFYFAAVRRPAFGPKAPPVTNSNWPIVGDLGFWNARHDWWLRSVKQTKSKNFSFHVGEHRIVASSSEQGMKLYLESKQLGFQEG